MPKYIMDKPPITIEQRLERIESILVRLCELMLEEDEAAPILSLDGQMFTPKSAESL